MRNTLKGLLFASPWLIGFLGLTLYPIVMSFYYGFTSFNAFQPPKFVGLDNYTELFHDDLFWKSMRNTLFITLLGTPLNLAFALLAALLLNLKVRGMAAYRTLFYMPTIVPIAASTLLWIWILNGQYGLLNTLLSKLGLYAPSWLGDPVYTKPSLLIMGVWAVGNVIVIFLAALQDVSAALYEAAEIDGASTLRKFFHITLPGISPIILFQLIMQLINGFQYFSQAYLVIGSSGGLNGAQIGGPENSLLLYAVYLYHNAFYYLKMGKASAMAWLMFICVGVVTWAVFKGAKKLVTYGGE
ncbi:carbohydrate ABC transporter membrane protein 1 (CUT1 family) [Paenibacillus taihuensis]|uniref:Carbohydrate ABC transporter membrane protein 1 (CUT1 family) n=1 Tax=Paenibacillus taihuensis TaxID=1156355 RepID=A0A3D9PYJ0_9BACL|nr:sugar ABC transporter permease [Paenibacillus taihuensis]REE55451.1 carbohydrate ABC transporter membrane protein 1 (CUT1 family) [Paenibacillus taihuensis]